VDYKRENSYPYCYFSETNGNCNGWNLAQNSYRFPMGGAANDGVYFARALEYSAVSNKIRVDERAFRVNRAQSNLMNVDVEIATLGDARDDEESGQFAFYALDLEANVSSYGGSIDRVEMSIISPNGTLVHQSTDYDAPYCAFGDAGADSCVRWDFSQHGNKWPQGKPVYNAMYTFRLVGYNGNIPVAGYAQANLMDSPLKATSANNPPPNNNPPSSNFAILADGQNDVSEVWGRLVFRTRAGDGNDGDNIDHVAMFIVDEDGNTVHVKDPEASPKYCAFGGNEVCNPFVFDWEGYQWYDGTPMRNNGQYTLYATVYFRSNKSPINLSRTVTIHF
jgi:hypothetical protein